MRFPLFSATVATATILASVLPATAITTKLSVLEMACKKHLDEEITLDLEPEIKPLPTEEESQIKPKLKLYKQLEKPNITNEYCEFSRPIFVGPEQKIPPEILYQIR